jgi:HEAT repeat protein
MEELIKEFRITISNILLYPPESSIIADSLEKCSTILFEALEEVKTLAVSESEGTLLANGEPIAVSGGIFSDCLANLEIRNLVFSKGVTQAELYNLLRNLAMKQSPESSPHVEVSHKVYVPIGEKDVVIEMGEAAGEDSEEQIAKITDELRVLIDSFKSEKTKNRIRKKIVKGLSLEKVGVLSSSSKAKAKPAAKPEKKPAGPEALSPLEEANELLQSEDESLLDEGVVDRVSTLFQSLDSPEELKLASSLCDKLTNNLESRVEDARLKAVLSFKRLYATIEALRDRDIIRSVDLKLVEATRKETDGEVYHELADLLSDAANRSLKEGNYEDTRAITGLLSEHAKSTEFEARSRHARETIDNLVGSEFTRLLVDDLCSEDMQKRGKASSVLLDIGDPCVPPLIDKLGQTVDLRLRKAIADLLVKIGDSAVKQLIGVLEETGDFQSALRILDVLDGIGHKEWVIAALRRQFGNPNFQLRRKALEVLYQIGTEPAREMLLEALDDESYVIREKAIEFLGSLHHVPAVARLIQVVENPDKGDRDSVQEEACKALGNLGDLAAVPTLLKVASPKTLFYGGKSREIRVAAVEALVKLGDTSVERFVDDKDPFVSRMAKESVIDGEKE